MYVEVRYDKSQRIVQTWKRFTRSALNPRRKYKADLFGKTYERL